MDNGHRCSSTSISTLIILHLIRLGEGFFVGAAWNARARVQAFSTEQPSLIWRGNRVARATSTYMATSASSYASPNEFISHIDSPEAAGLIVNK